MMNLLSRGLTAATIAFLASPAFAADHAVSFQSMAFSPAVLEIAVGDTVTFTNLEAIPHTATATDGSFDTGRLGLNDSATITFDEAGEFDYVCALHPRMTGKIVVQ